MGRRTPGRGAACRSPSSGEAGRAADAGSSTCGRVLDEEVRHVPARKVRGMTEAWREPPRRAQWTYGALMLGRVVLTITVLFGAYFLLPARRPDDGSGVMWL